MLSPQERRARIVHSYVAGALAGGYAADPIAIERMVVADCELVDRAGSPIKRAARHAVDPDEPVAPKAPTMPKPAGDVVRIKQLHADPRKVSPRWAHAVARLKRICDHAASGSSMGDVDNADVPKLAKEYVMEWMYLAIKDQPAPLRGTDHNPYRAMSDVDAGHKFQRRCEDICDRSTGKFGQWFVPK